jgi:hypothetical protein
MHDLHNQHYVAGHDIVVYRCVNGKKEFEQNHTHYAPHGSHSYPIQEQSCYPYTIQFQSCPKGSGPYLVGWCAVFHFVSSLLRVWLVPFSIQQSIRFRSNLLFLPRLSILVSVKYVSDIQAGENANAIPVLCLSLKDLAELECTYHISRDIFLPNIAPKISL